MRDQDLRIRRLRPESDQARSIESEVSVLACFSSGETFTTADLAQRLHLEPAAIDAIARNLVRLQCLVGDPIRGYKLPRDMPRLGGAA